MSRTSFISVWRSLQSRSKCPWDVWILGQQRPAMTQSRIFRELWGLDFGLRANESCLRDIRGTEELLPALKLFFFFLLLLLNQKKTFCAFWSFLFSEILIGFPKASESLFLQFCRTKPPRVKPGFLLIIGWMLVHHKQGVEASDRVVFW